MRVGLIAAVVFIFACLTLLSVTIDSGSMASSTETMSNLTTVRDAQNSESTWQTVISVGLAPIHWIQGVYRAASWNYSFLDNQVGVYFKWIIGGPITAAVVAGLILMFIWLLYKVL